MIKQQPWELITINEQLKEELLNKGHTLPIQYMLSEFKCYSDFIDTVEAGDITAWKRKFYGALSRERTSDDGWHGTKTFEEAIDLARNGWPEGLKKLTDTHAKYEHYRKTEKIPDSVADIVGAYPIVPLFCAGDPAHMAVVENDKRTKQKVISFVVDCAANGDVDREVFINRGAAILSVITELELLGYSCDLVVTRSSASTCESKVLMRSYIPLKTAGFYTEPDRIAFALLNPAFFRRLAFGCQEMLPEDMLKNVGSGYGTSTNTNCLLNFFDTHHSMNREVYFPRINGTDKRIFEKPSVEGLNHIRAGVAKAMGKASYTEIMEAA